MPATKAFTLTESPLYTCPAEPTQAAAARICSVLPLLSKKVRRWLAHLGSRERAQFDLEDILQELWVELLRRDPAYDPARGKYTTFSVLCTTHFLQGLRARVGLVSGARSALEYLSGRKPCNPETLQANRFALNEVQSLKDRPDPKSEQTDQDLPPALLAAVLSLPPADLKLVAETYGLFGYPATPKAPTAPLQRQLAKALAQLRLALEEQASCPQESLDVP